MTEQERLIAQAREVWQGAAPSEAEILRGAARVGRRLTARARPFARPLVVSLGACAAFLAALAYAGTQKWIEPARLHHVDPQPTTAPSVLEVVPPSPSEKSDTPKLNPQPIPTPPAINEAKPAPEPVTPSTNESPVRSTNDRQEPTSAVDATRGHGPNAASRPSWAEVSEALSGGDEKHAESLLSDLARRGLDADDRAKAKLGLAQLEASHGNCARARVLALQVAAVQGIELKTVRRALELAAHCTQ